MKYLVLVVLLLFSFVAKAQTDCGPAYKRIRNEADNDFEQGLFKKAFEGYRAARGCTKAELDYIDQQMSAALDSIEKQRLKSVAREELLQTTLKEIKATNSKLNKTQGNLVKALKDAEAARDFAELAEARALKLAQENERNLMELRATYKEKIASLLRQAEIQISRLNYDSVLVLIYNIHDLPSGKEETSGLLFECAFFYGESGQMEKAREVFGLLGEKINLDRKTIASYLKAQNSVQYDSLMKLYYPSFQRFNGGYFLSNFWDKKDVREKKNARLTIYKPNYKLVNTLTANTSYITNRQFYLFKPTKNIINTISIINQEKSFSSAKECATYLNWLSTQFNKIPFYNIKDSTISQQNDTFFISVVKNSNGFRLASKDEWEFLFKMNLGQIPTLKMESTMEDINLVQQKLKYWINENTGSISNSKSGGIWFHDFGSKSLSSIQLFSPNSYKQFINVFGSIRLISNDY